MFPIQHSKRHATWQVARQVTWLAGLMLMTSSISGATEVDDKAPQSPDGQVASYFETVVVTATARPERHFELPYTVQSLDASELIDQKMSRSVPEALKELGGVMVQKTSQGQGSPYLRGFTGFRNVFLVDGIRLNNSVLREGPNQYWNTVDAFSLEEIEVVKGPVSVIYGSGAVGGTVNVLTREPPSSLGSSNTFGGALYGRLASADESTVGRLELQGALRSGLRWTLGSTQKDFGDLEAGGDIGVQPKTGYREGAYDFKLRYAVGERSEWVAAWQDLAIDDAWRTHKTVHGVSFRGTSVGNEQRRVLDQSRSLGYLRFHHSTTGERGLNSWFDDLTANLSLHRQGEERDRVRRDGRQDLQGFDVDTLGLRLRLHKQTARGHWTYGVESYRDQVDSFRSDFDPQGELVRQGVQGPVADDATYDLRGAFVQYQTQLRDVELTLGIHTTQAQAFAAAVVDPQSGGTFTLDRRWNQTVGSLRFSAPLGAEQRWRLFGGVSQAFRAPNLSDLSRFDSARSDEIETPSPNLEPESFLAYELGVRWQSLRGSLELAVYRTEIDQLIVRTPTGRIIDDDFEVTKKNGGEGFSQGAELNARFRVAGHWTTFSTLSWLDGAVDTFPTSDADLVREPLDRLMPFTAHLGLRWQDPSRPWWVEGLVTVADRQDRLSTRDQADTQRIPEGGTPGYEILTLRGGWDVSERWSLSAALENLTDEAYRVHGSGITEAGRNVVLGVKRRF